MAKRLIEGGRGGKGKYEKEKIRKERRNRT